MRFTLLLLSLLLTINTMAQVTYTVTVPEGTQACFIAGEMTGWDYQQMTKAGTNLYTITIPYATTAQPYKYSSGPAWNFAEVTPGGANRTYTPNDVVREWALLWNGTNNIAPKAESGRIERHYFTSKLVDGRYVDVWLPEGYTNAKRYNVLYMHDGQMLFDAASSWNGQEWDVDSTLGKLLADHKINPTIVVGIHSNGNKRHAEYFPQKAISYLPELQQNELQKLFFGNTRADDYLKFIVTELKPFIDKTYATNTGKAHTFMAGSSMGGLISLYAFCEYPEVFSRAACLSTHWIGTFADNTQIPDAFLTYLDKHLPAPAHRRMYFDHGTTGLDAHYGTYQQKVDTLFKAKGYTSSNYRSLVFPGDDHNENAWKSRFRLPAMFILSETIPAKK